MLDQFVRQGPLTRDELEAAVRRFKTRLSREPRGGPVARSHQQAYRRGRRGGHSWHSRPLEPIVSVVFVDAQRVNVRDEATVRTKAVYLAPAVLPDGSRDILGIGIEATEGATS